jgi:predicted ArsR family transcriptional regulator
LGGLDSGSSSPPLSGARRDTDAGTPSSLRRAILIHLRQAGPSSPDALASAVGASRTGILQQLHALEAASLVSHAAEKHGVGRPRHVYDVTADAQGLFPTDYGGFASGLVKAIEAVGGDDLVEQVFAARRRQIGDRIRRRMAERLPDEASLVDRVQELAVLQNEARKRSSTRTARCGSESTTVRSTRSLAGPRRHATPSSRSSGSSSATTSSARRTSPRETGAAPTASTPRRSRVRSITPAEPAPASSFRPLRAPPLPAAPAVARSA